MMFTVSGEVRLDRAAEAALASLPSVEWVGPRGSGATLEFHHDGDTAVLTADGPATWVGTHLLEDLACAALVGEVHGSMYVAADDGFEEVSLAVFSGRARTFFGESSCLDATEVVVRRATVCEGSTGSAGARWFALVPDDAGTVDEYTAPCPAPLADRCRCAADPDARHGALPERRTLADGAAGLLDAAAAAPGGLDAFAALVGTDRVDEVVRWFDATCGGDLDATLAWLAAHPWGPLAASAAVQLSGALGRTGGPFDGPDDEARAVEVLARAATAGLGTRRELRLWSWAAGAVAVHPATTWDLAVVSGLTKVAAAQLAANSALCDDDVLTLPAAQVAVGAPWRFGDGLAAEVAVAMAPGWDGDAASLARVAHATAAEAR